MKKIFSSNPDIYKNAYMNWSTDKHQPIHNLYAFAEGYFDSAVLSIKACLVTIYFEIAKQSRTEIPNRPNAIYFTKKYSLIY